MMYTSTDPEPLGIRICVWGVCEGISVLFSSKALNCVHTEEDFCSLIDNRDERHVMNNGMWPKMHNHILALVA